jgi:hypothetical protein
MRDERLAIREEVDDLFQFDVLFLMEGASSCLDLPELASE